MSAMLVCVSHSPLILEHAGKPKHADAVDENARRVAQAVARFDPELIVFFGNNHFSGFHYANMPAYCVGAAAQAINDLGGFAGPLNVPADLAIGLIEHLRTEDFDPAVSYAMRVDHAYSQPLVRLTGALATYPVLPIFISVFTPPFLRFARTRRMGEAVGRFIAQSGKRVLVMGSGGLSHHPAHYFPLLGQASADVHGYQMDGEHGGTMTDAQWLARFARMHREGAEALASGLRTAADIRLNTGFDEQVLAQLQARRVATFDDWMPTELIETAGVGSLEIHNWIAATAAFAQADDTTPIDSFYAPVIEYGGGYGLLHSR